MLRIELTQEQRAALEQKLRRRSVSTDEHFRLRMLLLSDQGQTVPQIAQNLGKHPNTVRKFLHRFEKEGIDGLTSRKSPGAPRQLTEPILLALEATLDASERTWTSAQMVTWLAEQQNVSVHPIYLSRLMKRRGWRYKRTKSSLSHNQPDPETLTAKKEELAALKKGGWVRSH